MTRNLLMVAAVSAATTAHAQDTPERTIITNAHVFDGVNEARIEMPSS